MKNSISIVAASAFLFSSSATAQAPAGTCTSLLAAYDQASKDLAMNYASSIGDNSAPRATIKAVEDQNSLKKAHIALDLMRDNKCALPKYVPSMGRYLSPALTCVTDRMKATGREQAPSCDQSKWVTGL